MRVKEKCGRKEGKKEGDELRKRGMKEELKQLNFLHVHIKGKSYPDIIT